MNQYKVFIVDDEEIIRMTLSDDIRDMGFKVFEFGNPLIALLELEKIKPDIVFTDIKMPELNGIDLLKQIKQNFPNTIVVVMTAFGAISTAVEAVKSGAFDYLNKPFNIDELRILIDQILNFLAVNNTVQTITLQNQDKFNFNSVIGTSKEMQRVFELVKQVASSSSTVLITGETGTGKELISNIIHYNSKRKEKPFIKLSCAILSKDIFESELFGHEKGSFTGALKDKKGRFELANKGTLYLDDIDDIPLEMQVKLLRVLENQEFEKVGGEETIKIDVRIIASTKKDLKKLVSEGKFREDLYYRLNTFPINLSPLRERKEDIRILIDYYLTYFSQEVSKMISNEVYNYLESYSWPGNVRELKHLIERLVLISGSYSIDIKHLPNEIISDEFNCVQFDFNNSSLEDYLNKIELNLLKIALQKANGNKSKAAELLKIPYSTLRTKLEKFSL